MSRLDRLLRPGSIAVFGGKWAAAVVRQTLKMGFAGDIWPVHPTKDFVEGLPVFRTVEDLPAAPDACFVGVNRQRTVEIVRELAARSAGGAVCFASGFLETGEGDGELLQQELVDAAGSMPLLGPNCYGLINYADGALMWPDQHGGVRLPAGAKGVAIVSQSSNIALNMTMQNRGLPLAYVMTAGNQAQCGLSEIALGLIEDDRVSTLGLHIEGFDSVAGFEHLARRARELRKPVIALKVGRSQQAKLATTTHTASLAGSDEAAEAFLERLGIARLHSIPAFIESLKLLHVAGPLEGRHISSMSCSGGEACLIADSAIGRGVGFRALDSAHQEQMQRILGPLVAVANPLDYHTFIWNNRAALTETFTAFVSGGFDFNLLVLDFPREDRCSDDDWHATVDAFEAALKASGAKGGVLASLPENLPENWSSEILARGLVPLCGFDDAISAIESAALVGGVWKRRAMPPVFSQIIRTGARQMVNEASAKRRLAEFGLPVPPGAVAEDVDDAVAKAGLIGFPVAVKALGVAHKTEENAVRLNLADAPAVRCAATDLTAGDRGLYVEKMITEAVVELIAGVVSDPVFGPVLTIGAGGILAELLSDVRTLLLPASGSEIEAALAGMRLFPLLDGYRGRPKADIAAAVDVLQGISRFAGEHVGTIVEMDINPLIVREIGKGAFIADALIVSEEQQ